MIKYKIIQFFVRNWFGTSQARDFDTLGSLPQTFTFFFSTPFLCKVKMTGKRPHEESNDGHESPAKEPFHNPYQPPTFSLLTPTGGSHRDHTSPTLPKPPSIPKSAGKLGSSNELAKTILKPVGKLPHLVNLVTEAVRLVMENGQMTSEEALSQFLVDLGQQLVKNPSFFIYYYSLHQR